MPWRQTKGLKRWIQSAQSCTAASDETKTNCEPSSCATNYYPLKNDLTQCNYCESPCNNVDIYPIGYFLNEDTQLEKCYDNCYKCDSRYISDNNMGCVTCIEGSTILVYNEKICIKIFTWSHSS